MSHKVAPRGETAPIAGGPYAVEGEGVRLIVELPKGPGALEDPAAREIASWDTNDDGELDYAEVKQASMALLLARQRTRQWRNLSVVALGALAVVVAVFFGVMFAADESAREVDTVRNSDGSATLLSKGGNLVETKVTKGAGPNLWTYHSAPDSVLNALERLELPTGGDGNHMLAGITGWLAYDTTATAASASNGTSTSNATATASAEAAGSDATADITSFDAGETAKAPSSNRRVVLYLDGGMRVTCGPSRAILTVSSKGSDGSNAEAEERDVVYVRGPVDGETGMYDVVISSGAEVFDAGQDPIGELAKEAAQSSSGTAATLRRARSRHGDAATLHRGLDPLVAAAIGIPVPASAFGVGSDGGQRRRMGSSSGTSPTSVPRAVDTVLRKTAHAPISLLWAGHDDPEWHRRHNPHWRRRCVIVDPATGTSHLLPGGLAQAARHGHASVAVRRASRVHPLANKDAEHRSFVYFTVQPKFASLAELPTSGPDAFLDVPYPGQRLMTEATYSAIHDAADSYYASLLSYSSEFSGKTTDKSLGKFGNRDWTLEDFIRYGEKHEPGSGFGLVKVDPTETYLGDVKKAKHICGTSRGFTDIAYATCYRHLLTEYARQYCLALVKRPVIDTPRSYIAGPCDDDDCSGLSANKITSMSDWECEDMGRRRARSRGLDVDCQPKYRYRVIKTRMADNPFETCDYFTASDEDMDERLEKGQPIIARVNGQDVIVGFEPVAQNRVPCSFPEVEGTWEVDISKCDRFPKNKDGKYDIEAARALGMPTAVNPAKKALLDERVRPSPELQECKFDFGTSDVETPAQQQAYEKYGKGDVPQDVCNYANDYTNACMALCNARDDEDIVKCLAVCRCRGTAVILGTMLGPYNRERYGRDNASVNFLYANRVKTNFCETRYVRERKTVTRSKTVTKTSCANKERKYYDVAY